MTGAIITSFFCLKDEDGEEYPGNRHVELCVLCGEPPNYDLRTAMAYQDESFSCPHCGYSLSDSWGSCLKKWNELQREGAAAVKEYIENQKFKEMEHERKMALYYTSDTHLAEETKARAEHAAYEAERAKERMKNKEIRKKIAKALSEANGDLSFKELLDRKMREKEG